MNRLIQNNHFYYMLLIDAALVAASYIRAYFLALSVVMDDLATAASRDEAAIRKKPRAIVPEYTPQ